MATVFLDDGDVTLYQGNCLEVLRELESNSIDCCVTSPPYWKLRDYGVAEQLGLEDSPAAYVENIVAVFSEVRRALADHGTLWLNLGDTYVDKELVGIPWRVAFAMKDDGWILRSDCVWSKPNAMPSSVPDRPGVAHEYVFLFTKSKSYYWNHELVREAFRSSVALVPPEATLGDLPPEAPRGADGRRRTAVKTGDNSAQHRDGERWPNEGRNIRTVWEIVTQPYHGAHFAVFPEELPRRCILAGCPESVCTECGNTGGSCEHAATRPGVVLDPFHGTGTTSFVARSHGRHAIGIELNEQSCELARERLRQLSLLS